MRAELLVVDGCPHAAEAERRYRVALDVTGHNFVPVQVHVLDTMGDATGPCLVSPIFRINGVDLLSDDLAVGGQACRWTIPTTSDLVDAIGPRQP